MSDFYRPIFRRQIGDPTTTRDSYICTMSSGAMALDYHTRGAVQPWGGQLEKLQDDHEGGTDLYDLATAWRRYGLALDPPQDYTLEIRSGKGWANLKAALAEGRFVVLQGDYDRFTGAASCQAGFVDPHAIGLAPTTTAWALVADPLCPGYKVIDEGTVRAYAEKFYSGVRFAVSRAQPKEADMWRVKPSGKRIGTARFKVPGAYLLAVNDPKTIRYGPQNQTDVYDLLGLFRLVNNASPTAPIDIDGNSPPRNGRDLVALVDLPKFGASAFALQSQLDIKLDPTATTVTGYTKEQLDQLVKASVEDAVEVTKAKAKAVQDPPRIVWE